MKCNWAPVKLQSSELALVTCDRLSHQTSSYDIKKHTHTHRQQKYLSQLTLRSSVTASWGVGMLGGGCDWQGGCFRVGIADRPSQEGRSMPFLMFSAQAVSSRGGEILQWRLNLLVSVVSVWSDRFVSGPLPGSLTVITVFTKRQDRVPEIWIAHESINGLLTAVSVHVVYL